MEFRCKLSGVKDNIVLEYCFGKATTDCATTDCAGLCSSGLCSSGLCSSYVEQY